MIIAKNGNPQKTTPEDFKEYLISKVNIDSITGCWNWSGCKIKSKLPYGMMSFFGKTALVHRVSYWAFIDNDFSVKDNIEEDICHTCDNPSCCNPEHLFLGNAITNLEDMALKRFGKIQPLNVREIQRRFYYRQKIKVEKIDIKFDFNFK